MIGTLKEPPYRRFFCCIMSNTKHMAKDYLRTDIALERAVRPKKDDFGVSRIDISPREAKIRRLSAGRYISVESDSVAHGDKAKYTDIAIRLAGCIREVLPKGCKDYLVVGLGNATLTADSLGSKVLDRLIVTRHLKSVGDKMRKGMSKVCILRPGVLGATGVESFDIIKSVVDRLNPKCVIVVDSLAAAEYGRLATIFQVSDAGLTPGSGVGNRRHELSRETLGCPVVTIGVPLVVYASTIVAGIIDRISDKCKEEMHESITDSLVNHIVTPKDIDFIVSECADVAALALNIALHEGLGVDEVRRIKG